jgi:hypothetical protein
MMKKRGILAGVAVLLCLSAGSLMAAPVTGLYLSTELGGTVIDGRWSEGWAGGQEGAIGSTIGAESWNGAALGTMWELSGAAIDSSPTLVSSVLEYGMTVQKWYTTYSGGSLKLKDTGSWWNAGDPGTEYDLTITSFSNDTTKYFSGSTFVSSTSLVHFVATFDAYPGSSVDFVIAVAVPTGMGTTVPADYPAFGINAPAGAWGVAQKIRMEIVPEPATLAILGLGGLLLRRRLA